MRGGRGMTASLDPLPTTVTMRWPRSAPRSSTSIEQASEDPQAQQPEQAGQGMVGGASRRPAGDEGAELHPVQAEGGGLGADLGTTHELGGGMRDKAVDHREAVEADDGREPTSDRGPGEAPLFHGTGPQLEVPPAGGEHLEALRGAPGEVLTQVGGVGGAGGPGVASQESGDGQAGLIEQRRSGDADGGGGHGSLLWWWCVHRATGDRPGVRGRHWRPPPRTLQHVARDRLPEDGSGPGEKVERAHG